mgnify:CR=1 FL=1
MQFLTSREAVDFLSQAAPRPWVCRILQWMVIDDQIWAYFSKGQVQASTSAFHFLFPLADEAKEDAGPKIDALIEKKYEPDLAAKIKGKSHLDTIFDEPYELEAGLEKQTLDPGFFLFGSNIDWDAGVLESDWLPTERGIVEMFFPTAEYEYSEFENADYSCRLEGLSFDKARIEMMLPNLAMGETGLSNRSSSTVGRHVGRPRTWDWDGAMAHIVAQAQTPDGLPTGHGAQARIETMIAEWFESEVGGSPAVSQIRKRASTIMRTMEKG